MPRRVELPKEFRNRAFSAREAHEAGLGRGRLLSADLEAPFRGARRLVETDAAKDDTAWVRRRCEAFAPLLGPDQFFSHTTAAHLWGCPFHVDELDEVLHVTSRAPDRAPRRNGLVGHQTRDTRVVPLLRFGLPVADAASVFLQLAELLSLDELVAAGDHLILDPPVLDPHDLRPHLRLASLIERMGSHSGRGARKAAAALALMRPGAESRPETLLRLLLQRAGFPEPEVNPELTGVRRRWTHRADLVYRRWKVIAEYDGDRHCTDSRQYDRDIRRFDDFAEDGWRVIRVRKRGLFATPEDTVERVRTALLDSGWRP